MAPLPPTMIRLLRVALYLAALFALVMALLPHPPHFPGPQNDKFQHTLAFATLAALAGFAYPRRSLWPIFFVLSAFGAMIEILQAIPVLHRDTQLSDLVTDMLAAGAVLLLHAAWRRWVRKDGG